jgi:hypothetical protein
MSTAWLNHRNLCVVNASISIVEVIENVQKEGLKIGTMGSCV